MIYTDCQSLTPNQALQSFFRLYQGLDECLQHRNLRPWLAQLPQQILEGLSLKRWGDLPQWLDHWQALPQINEVELVFNEAAVGLKPKQDDALDLNQLHANLHSALMGLHPWRKGPFNYFGVDIDTEWRSNLKWSRISPHLALKGKRILDIGCGNGYYGWRMLGEGAQSVIGIDPSPRFVLQWGSIQRYSNQPCYVLPLGIEHLPNQLEAFDMTFSMGVLYHRKCPFTHLQQLKDTLVPGGQLILETIVIDGANGMTLLPKDRYAKMRNVWLLPSVETLLSWLDRCGFLDAQVLDVSQTTTQEQRATSWMTFESLADFLDPKDENKTIEGYAAPKRAVIVCHKPA